MPRVSDQDHPIASVREDIVSTRPSPAAVRIFSMVNGLTLLGVLLQAVWAGQFIDRAERAT